MAGHIPKVPHTSDRDFNSIGWQNFFRDLMNWVTVTGSIAWDLVNKSGSNLTDILTRRHRDLQDLQGGTTAEYYHMTLAQHNIFINSLGDTLYSSGTNVLSKLPGNTTAIQMFLTQTGTGSASAAPSWQPLPVQGNLLYYLWDTASDVGTYKKLLTSPPVGKTTLTTTGVVNGQVLGNWITEPGFPGLLFIPAGQLEAHTHASQTAGTKVGNYHVEIWEANAAGVDIAKIAITESTATDGGLTGAETQFHDFASIGQPFVLTGTTSRLVMRVIAEVTGLGTAPTINLYYGDGADSFLDIPLGSIDATTFVPYNGATADVDLGTKNLTASTIKGSTGYKSSDNSDGITTTVTTASLVGKTITVKNGLITDFS